MTLFPSLEIVITLDCNGACPNCIRLVNTVRPDITMTLADVRRVCSDIADVHHATGQRVFETVCITGGEPTLHPQLLEIWQTCRALLPPYMIGELVCNVNRTRPVPSEIEPHVVHWWSLREKAQLHQCALISPTDPPKGFPNQGARTWETCRHYRRDRMIVTVHGYQLCCAAEGYTRLLGLSDLLVPKLPASMAEMPRPDPVCTHCAFGAPVGFAEREYGCPVSPVFREAAEARHVLPQKLRER